MDNLQDTFTLSNGILIPCLGFGTWRIQGEAAEEAVTEAIGLGFRHVDTAAVYENEVEVGRAIRSCGVARSELFVTSKLWNSNRTFDESMRAFDETMTRLQLDYLDLYLIHWPSVLGVDEDWAQTNREKWRALERLHAEGRVRAIGVSNYLSHHLAPLLASASIAPMVNQLEIHPGFAQHETVAFCQAQGILPQAWSPLARGKVLDNPDLTAIAARLGRTTAQVCLRWCLQNGVLPLTKTTSPARMMENAEIFDFAIPDADMNTINALLPCGGACIDPDARTF